MCSPEAKMALQVCSAVQSHNAKQKTANDTERSNFHAKNSANAALFDDYSSIDASKKQAGAEKTAEKFALDALLLPVFVLYQSHVGFVTCA